MSLLSGIGQAFKYFALSQLKAEYDNDGVRQARFPTGNIGCTVCERMNDSKSAFVVRKDELRHKNCGVCAVIAHGVDELIKVNFIRNRHKSSYEVGQIWNKPNITIHFRKNVYTIPLPVFNLRVEAHHPGFPVLDLEIFLDQVDTTSPFLRVFGSASRSRSSTPRIQIAKEWLDECVDCHGYQCQLGNAFMPKRLLDINDDNDGQIRLIESFEEFQETRNIPAYSCLSYCWGKSKSLTTTTATLVSRLNGIALDELPRTIKDAVVVSRSLGIYYLWVDALCIVQDDRREWMDQSAVMGEIYGHARVSIVAGTAEDCDHGFLYKLSEQDLRLPASKRPSHLHKKTALSGILMDHVEISATDESGRSAQIFIRESMLERFTENDSVKLETRAWTLQEFLLSNRILYFGKHEMEWHCNECVRTESYLPSASIDWQSPFGSRYKDVLRQSLLDRRRDTVRYGIIWRAMVRKYLWRELTFEQDRLIALSGIIARCRDVVGLQCKAGIWQFGDLLWSSDESELPGLRIRPHRVPTWSWASVSGLKIYFPGYNRTSKIVDHSDPYVAMAQIREMECETSLENGVETVIRGHLSLKAHVFRSKLVLLNYQAETSAVRDGRRQRIVSYINRPTGIRTQRAFNDLEAAAAPVKPPLMGEIVNQNHPIGKIGAHWQRFFRPDCVDFATPVSSDAPQTCKEELPDSLEVLCIWLGQVTFEKYYSEADFMVCRRVMDDSAEINFERIGMYMIRSSPGEMPDLTPMFREGLQEVRII